METTVRDKARYLLKFAVIIAAVYFCVKYLLFIFLPFLIAYVLKLMLRPIVNILVEKFKFNRKVISVILLILISALLLSVVILFVTILTKQVKKFAVNSGYYVEKVDNIMDRCCDIVEKYSGIESREVRVYIDEGAEKLFEDENQSGIAYKVMNKSVDVIKLIVNGAITIFTAILAAYYMLNKTSYKEEGKKNIEKSIEKNEKINRHKEKSDAIFRDARILVRRVTDVCAAYVKTQFIIMAFTFIVCLTGFFLIGNDYAFLISAIVGLLDTLPLIGVGTMLVPMAIIYVIMERYTGALIILLTFAICYMFREVMEPRLMGNKIGISPLATIVSIYAGLKTFGIIGVLLGPVVYILIIEIMKITEED